MCGVCFFCECRIDGNAGEASGAGLLQLAFVLIRIVFVLFRVISMLPSKRGCQETYVALSRLFILALGINPGTAWIDLRACRGLSLACLSTNILLAV